MAWQSAGAQGIASTMQGLCSTAWSMTWVRFWMRHAGLGPWGRFATRLAVCFVPPYKERSYLAQLNPHGYIAPSAIVRHPGLQLGAHVFIGDQVIIYQAQQTGGPVRLGDRVRLHRDSIIEVGSGGSLTIGADTHIQPRCQFSAYEAPIRIGCGVQIAPYCAFYPYDHGFAPGIPIREQPLTTKGGITIGDEAWLGVGVIVLDGVRIGQGAVIGAGAVVVSDIPDDAIAVGVPASVVKMRSDLPDLSGHALSDSRITGAPYPSSGSDDAN
jgi:acetyltransferase-like isoleucine patch superfamily enzyme